MNQRLLPPGPWKLPIIGSLHHFIGALPHHVLRNLSGKYGPIMHLKLGEIDAVVVSSPHLAKQVLKVHDLSFAARTKLVASDIIFYRQKGVAFAEYGDYWKQMRKICTSELLSAKMVKSFNLIRQDEVHNLVASIHSTPNVVVNMSEMVLQLTSSVICRSAIGKVWDDRDNLLTSMREVLDENIINDHKQNKANGEKGNNEFEGEDLIDVLLRVMENDGLQFHMTNDNIKAVILNLNIVKKQQVARCLLKLNLGDCAGIISTE
nr:premnaspirodiene oxygenase-like [Solanum lycopersicum]